VPLLDLSRALVPALLQRTLANAAGRRKSCREEDQDSVETRTESTTTFVATCTGMSSGSDWATVVAGPAESAGSFASTPESSAIDQVSARGSTHVGSQALRPVSATEALATARDSATLHFARAHEVAELPPDASTRAIAGTPCAGLAPRSSVELWEALGEAAHGPVAVEALPGAEVPGGINAPPGAGTPPEEQPLRACSQRQSNTEAPGRPAEAEVLPGDEAPAGTHAPRSTGALPDEQALRACSRQQSHTEAPGRPAEAEALPGAEAPAGTCVTPGAGSPPDKQLLRACSHRQSDTEAPGRPAEAEAMLGVEPPGGIRAPPSMGTPPDEQLLSAWSQLQCNTEAPGRPTQAEVRVPAALPRPPAATPEPAVRRRTWSDLVVGEGWREPSVPSAGDAAAGTGGHFDSLLRKAVPPPPASLAGPLAGLVAQPLKPTAIAVDLALREEEQRRPSSRRIQHSAALASKALPEPVAPVVAKHLEQRPPGILTAQQPAPLVLAAVPEPMPEPTPPLGHWPPDFLAAKQPKTGALAAQPVSIALVAEGDLPMMPVVPAPAAPVVLSASEAEKTSPRQPRRALRFPAEMLEEARVRLRRRMSGRSKRITLGRAKEGSLEAFVEAHL